jgi:hypothetical protein
MDQMDIITIGLYVVVFVLGRMLLARFISAD